MTEDKPPAVLPAVPNTVNDTAPDTAPKLSVLEETKQMIAELKAEKEEITK